MGDDYKQYLLQYKRKWKKQNVYIFPRFRQRRVQMDLETVVRSNKRKSLEASAMRLEQELKRKRILIQCIANYDGKPYVYICPRLVEDVEVIQSSALPPRAQNFERRHSKKQISSESDDSQTSVRRPIVVPQRFSNKEFFPAVGMRTKSQCIAKAVPVIAQDNSLVIKSSTLANLLHKIGGDKVDVHVRKGRALVTQGGDVILNDSLTLEFEGKTYYAFDIICAINQVYGGSYQSMLRIYGAHNIQISTNKSGSGKRRCGYCRREGLEVYSHSTGSKCPFFNKYSKKATSNDKATEENGGDQNLGGSASSSSATKPKRRRRCGYCKKEGILDAYDHSTGRKCPFYKKYSTKTH